ncbi:MAG: hypothetical protein ACYCW6_16125 [Candidatus Xenobia bacterium]
MGSTVAGCRAGTRRTFATFEESEKRQLGEQLSDGVGRQVELDEARAAAVLPVVKRLLGLP